MSNAAFGFSNNVITGGISTSSSVTGLDGSQLRNDQGSASTAWQTTGCSAEIVRITTSATTTWQAFGLFRTNLTPSATVQWYVGGINPFSLPVAAGFGQAVIILPASVSGTFVQVNISDPTNPDGFINVPLMYAGPAWTPQTNIDYTTAFGRDDQVDEVLSRGGQEFPSVQWTRRRWDVSMQGIRASEVWTQAMALDLAARAGGNVLFAPNPAGADLPREAVFGRLKSLADLSFPFGNADRRAWKARITERL